MSTKCQFGVHILSLLILLAFSGCAPRKRVVTDKSERERERIEYRERIEFVKDTVYIELPRQTAEVTVRDSVSTLENDIAFSLARINADGTLYHNLLSKPLQKAVEVEVRIEYRDSVVYQTKEVEVTKEIQVPRSLNAWENIQIYGFWVLLALIFVFVSIRRMFST